MQLTNDFSVLQQAFNDLLDRKEYLEGVLAGDTSIYRPEFILACQHELEYVIRILSKVSV